MTTSAISLRPAWAILLVFFSSGCTWDFWNKDFVTPEAKLSPPGFHRVALGMSKEDVVVQLGPPDQLIGAKTVDGKMVETWEYIRIAATPGPDRIAERYQVQFTEGKLTSFESSGDFKQQVNLR